MKFKPSKWMRAAWRFLKPRPCSRIHTCGICGGALLTGIRHRCAPAMIRGRLLAQLDAYAAELRGAIEKAKALNLPPGALLAAYECAIANYEAVLAGVGEEKQPKPNLCRGCCAAAIDAGLAEAGERCQACRPPWRPLLADPADPDPLECDRCGETFKPQQGGAVCDTCRRIFCPTCAVAEMKLADTMRLRCEKCRSGPRPTPAVPASAKGSADAE